MIWPSPEEERQDYGVHQVTNGCQHSMDVTNQHEETCSRGPKCSAAGEGGGDGGKLVVSSTDGSL